MDCLPGWREEKEVMGNTSENLAQAGFSSMCALRNVRHTGRYTLAPLPQDDGLMVCAVEPL
jgi:hypothetical protein